MRAQVTLFIILILIVVFGFGFLFYVVVQSNAEAGFTEKQLLLEELRAQTTIDNALQSCLDEAILSGIILLGEQGGYFFENQEVNTPYGMMTITDAYALSDFVTHPTGKSLALLIKNPARIPPYL